jgi:hypothetical protein
MFPYEGPTEAEACLGFAFPSFYPRGVLAASHFYAPALNGHRRVAAEASFSMGAPIRFSRSVPHCTFKNVATQPSLRVPGLTVNQPRDVSGIFT